MKYNFKHGESHKTREYRIWKSMRYRCSNAKAISYKYYGGRGITVCDRWAKYENFIQDMGRSPSEKHSIDRIDNNGNYEPSNCRWATRREQRLNQRQGYGFKCRHSKKITFNGVTKDLADWGKLLDGDNSLISKRLKRGWSIEKALTTPKRA